MRGRHSSEDSSLEPESILKKSLLHADYMQAEASEEGI